MRVHHAMNLIVLTLAMFVSWGAAELVTFAAGIELASPRHCPGEEIPRESANFVVDPIIGWRMRPSREFEFPTEGRAVRYRSDNAGFRTSARDGAAAGADRRIVLAGDSYAWGYGVAYEESLAGRLEKRLRAEVHNLAMPGFGLDQVWLSVRRYGLPAEPDLIVITIYPDDLERSMSAFRDSEGFAKPSFRLSEGGLVLRRPEDCPGSIVRFLESHSRLYSLQRRLALRIGREQGYGSWWALNAAILDAIRADAASQKVPVLFIHVPYESRKPFPSLGAYMERTGTPYIDLYVEFGEEHSRYYFSRDGHLNAAGHEKLSQLVESWVLRSVQ